MEVINPESTHFYEDEGIIFIENAPSGNYQLLVKGKEKGDYQIVVGQITENNDIWEKIDRSITALEPENEIDTYQINFSSISAILQFITPTPTVSSSNFSNQPIQSHSSNNVNQSNSSNQSSNQNNPSSTPTLTEKLLNINSSIPKESLANEPSKKETKNNVLGEKTKKEEENQKKPNTILINLSIIVLLILTIIGYYKKNVIVSLIAKWMKNLKNFSGR